MKKYKNINEVIINFKEQIVEILIKYGALYRTHIPFKIGYKNHSAITDKNSMLYKAFMQLLKEKRIFINPQGKIEYILQQKPNQYSSLNTNPNSEIRYSQCCKKPAYEQRVWKDYEGIGWVCSWCKSQCRIYSYEETLELFPALKPQTLEKKSFWKRIFSRNK